MIDSGSTVMVSATEAERIKASQRAFAMIMEIVRGLGASDEQRSMVIHQIVIIENAERWSGFYSGYESGVKAASERVNLQVSQEKTWETYPLERGSRTSLGVVELVSNSAYLIDGKWVPHFSVHGPRPVSEPLVRLS